MSNLIISARKIHDIPSFEAIERKTPEYIQIMQNYQGSIYENWKKLYDFLKPGVATDGTLAVEITIRLAGGSGDEDAGIFARSAGKAVADVFGARNLISCFYKDGTNPVCYCTVLPLDRRRLNPDKWLDTRHPERVNADVKHTIEDQVQLQFKDLITDKSKAAVSPEEAGYMPALVAFQPPEEKKEDNTELVWDTPELDSQIQSEIPYDQLRRITDETLSYFTVGPEKTLYERVLRGSGDVDEEGFLREVEQYLKREHPLVSAHDDEIILSRIFRAVFQNYILEPLINDEAISDIKVIAPDKIRVKVGGERYTSNFKFMNKEDYLRFIRGLAVRNNLDLSQNAINVFSDVKTNDKFRLRFNITTPYINSVEWPYLHIRKISKKKRGMDYLLKAGMLDQKIADYLINCARNGKGLIFCGKGASGKTTLMNCLLDYIPFDKSGLVIQESDELFSDVHPDLMFQHVTMNVLAGNKTYDLQAEARNGLLTDLDYFIIGEVKGAEAKYFINAADTGHRCWCSVHSPSSLDAIDKLADYVMYETKYSKQEAEYMLKDLGTVVFMKNFKVCEISELDGWVQPENPGEEGHLKYKPVYKRKG